MLPPLTRANVVSRSAARSTQSIALRHPVLVPSGLDDGMFLAQRLEGAWTRDAGQTRLAPELVESLTRHLPVADWTSHVSPEDVAAFLAGQLGSGGGEFSVKALGGGLSGAQVFDVTRNGQALGIFKVFADRAELLREVGALARLNRYALGDLGAVRALLIACTVDGRGLLLMERASGRVLLEMMDEVVGARGLVRQRAFARFASNLRRAARVVAAAHDEAASGSPVPASFREEEILQARGFWTQARAARGLAGPLGDAVECELEALFATFRDAAMTGTLVHGDLAPGNIAVGSERCVLFDVATHYRSVGAGGEGIASAVTDVGPFCEFFAFYASRHAFSEAEAREAAELFLGEYRAHSALAREEGFDVALRFYRAFFALKDLQREVHTEGWTPETSPAFIRLGEQLDGAAAA